MDEEFVDPNEHYANREITTPENHSGDDDESATLYRVVGWLALSAVILTVGYSYADMDWLFGSNDQTAQIESSIPKAQPARLSDKPTGTEIVADKVQEITGLSLPESIDWRKQEEIAANRSAVEDFRAKLESISSLGTANAEQLIALQAKTQELLTSEAGAKIGSDSKYVEQYIALQQKIEKLTVSIPVADKFARDMLALLNRVEASGDTSYAPQEFVTTRATDYQKQSQEKTNELKKYEVAVDGIVAATGHLVGELPLESAIKSLLEKEDAELAEALSEARKKMIEIKSNELAEAEKNKVAKEADYKIAKVNADAATVEAKRKALLLAEAERKLENEFAASSGEIQTYLQYLLADGRDKRGVATGVGPVSYNAVAGSGALDEGVNGLIEMSKWIGSNFGMNETNSRAKNSTALILVKFMFSQPKYESSIQYAENAQRLLKKFGPLMVKKGLLAE
jgi:hypothetical protein